MLVTSFLEAVMFISVPQNSPYVTKGSFVIPWKNTSTDRKYYRSSATLVIFSCFWKFRKSCRSTEISIFNNI